MAAMGHPRTPRSSLSAIGMGMAGLVLVTTLVSVRTATQPQLQHAAAMAPRTLPNMGIRAASSCASRLPHMLVVRQPMVDRRSLNQLRTFAEDDAAAEPAAEAAPAESVEVSESKIDLKDLVVGDVYSGTVKAVVNFGAFVDIGATKDALLHVSDLGEQGFIADASKFINVGDTVEVKVKSVDPASEKLSVTANKEARTALSALEVGSMIEGVVRNVASFGAFVDVGAEKDGLLHISQLSGGFVEDINEKLKEGDKLNVRISGVDLDNGKLTLSMREKGAERKQTRKKQDVSAYEGRGFEDKVTGSVVGVESFGAFIELEDGIKGLLPISCMAEGRIEKVEDVMKVGDQVTVAVLQANPSDGKISFTLIDPASVAAEEKKGKSPAEGRGGGRDQSYYEDALAKAQPGRVLAQHALRYDEQPFLGAMGGAFAAAGIQMSDKAKDVLRKRVDEEYADHFAAKAARLEAEAAAVKEAEAAAVAAAAQAEADAAAAAEAEAAAAAAPEAEADAGGDAEAAAA